MKPRIPIILGFISGISFNKFYNDINKKNNKKLSNLSEILRENIIIKKNEFPDENIIIKKNEFLDEKNIIKKNEFPDEKIIENVKNDHVLTHDEINKMFKKMIDERKFLDEQDRRRYRMNTGIQN